MSPATDIVSLAALHLAATIGPDQWHRTRPQPIHLTLHLHLAPSYLDAPGKSDNVTDSLHYGHLAKAVERRVGAKAESNEGSYASARALAEDVTDAAFRLVRDAVGGKKGAVARDGDGDGDGIGVIRAVRVVLELPKQILLAGGFEVELTTRAQDWAPRSAGSRSEKPGAIVRVTDLILPVLIGVNPPERLAKQRVITHLTFFEAPPRTSAEVVSGGTEVLPEGGEEIDYPAVVQQIAMDIESSTHLTLEKLVYEIIHTAYRATDVHPNSSSNACRIDAVTVRCQKPSALSFADASVVEMTRTRQALRLVGN